MNELTYCVTGLILMWIMLLSIPLLPDDVNPNVVNVISAGRARRPSVHGGMEETLPGNILAAM